MMMTVGTCVYAGLIHCPQLYLILAIMNNVTSASIQQSLNHTSIDQTCSAQQGSLFKTLSYLSVFQSVQYTAYVLLLCKLLLCAAFCEISTVFTHSSPASCHLSGSAFMYGRDLGAPWWYLILNKNTLFYKKYLVQYKYVNGFPDF